jgi:hypothetical protein
VSKGNAIRVYDYVNHPYEAVREILAANAQEVFRNATKVAAVRAKSLASELRVNVGGIEIGTDINITVKSVDAQPKQAAAPPTTRIALEWEAAKMPGLFPFVII